MWMRKCEGSTGEKLMCDGGLQAVKGGQRRHVPVGSKAYLRIDNQIIEDIFF